MSLLGRLFYKSRKFYDDDFDWNSYTDDSYKRRIETDIESQFQAVAQNDQLGFDTASGHVTVSGSDMHPNHLLILEAIGQLQPKSVHEVGCGGGDHVANGQTLFPQIAFTGGDRGQTQLDMAMSRHPELIDAVALQDITMPLSRHWPRADFVYSQAVLMHIHTAVSHFVGLANMVNLSDRFVLLMENYQCHNFIADIQNLRDGGHFDWPELYIYRFDGSTGARAILLSREKLDLPEIESDAQIREGLTASDRRLKRSDEDSARGIFGPKH
ncbi:hypothetical protein [Ascidiaceihabitans sp.]|uniref:hypothetical protein n=1 Tax=Ascidiaceihabitans sp. TaxID=1872644 RepID=UPI00329A4C54